MQKLIDVNTVASVLDCCPATVRKLIRDGHIRSIKVGRQLRIDPADLEAFINR
jgi:excisionase family DNA binding protein